MEFRAIVWNGIYLRAILFDILHPLWNSTESLHETK